VKSVYGKPLTLNVSLPIAAVLLDLGYPPVVAQAVAILARPARLLAHLAEEQEHPIGFLLASRAAAQRRLQLSRAPPAPPRASPRPRSPSYRQKLAGQDTTGGLESIARLPLTDKREVKATCTPDNPFGMHLCVGRDEIARIYSTSGTTGTPSYIPLTAADVENWVTGSARSYAASGISPGDTVVTTYNAGPFVAGAALDAFARIGITHVPVGTGSSERLLLAIEQLRPDAVVLTPSYAAYLLE